MMQFGRDLSAESLAARITATAAALEDAVRSAGVLRSPDGRVGSDDATRLLDLSPATMRNQRTQGRGPIAYRFPVGTSRVSYKILDLAAWIEIARQE
jgi:hypothetical protein